MHSSSNIARKYEALKEAHEALKLETARDKAVLAGQRSALRSPHDAFSSHSALQAGIVGFREKQQI